MGPCRKSGQQTCCGLFRHKLETVLPEAVKSAREGRNPATGQEIDIPARKSVKDPSTNNLNNTGLLVTLVKWIFKLKQRYVQSMLYLPLFLTNRLVGFGLPQKHRSWAAVEFPWWHARPVCHEQRFIKD